jgi:hypothetical protein
MINFLTSGSATGDFPPEAGKAPHKPFGLERLDMSSSTCLTAERFTPPDKFGIFDMPGVHKALHPTAGAVA